MLTDPFQPSDPQAAVFDDLPVPALIIAADGQAAAYANRAFTEFTGAIITGGATDLAPWLHPEDYPALQAQFRDTGDAEAPIAADVRIRRRDGTWIRHRLTAGNPAPRRVVLCVDVQSLHDGAAASAADQATLRLVQKVGGIGTPRDIAAPRILAQALTETEAQLRAANDRVQIALAAGAIVGTWTRDPATGMFLADEGFAQIFGLDPAQCRAGLDFEKVRPALHPEDIPRLRATNAEALARGGPYVCRYRVRTAGGAYRWIETNGRVDLAEDGTPLRFSGVLIDIEARQAVEAERDRAVALLRSVLATVPGVVYAKDRDGRMLLANAGAADLIGKAPAEFIGRTDAEFLADKREAALVMENDRRVMETGVTQRVEERVTRPDGTPAIWLSTKAPFCDGAGTVIGLVGTSIDITEQKQAEDALERLVEQRTRDLRIAQERLAHAQRMEALGQLAGGIAHDFNNVLQAVQGGAHLIARRPADAERVASLAAMIVDSATRGAAITSRLLAFSRRGNLHAQPIDAGTLFAGLREVLGHTLGPGIRIVIDVPTGLPRLLADQGQLETVLINLATNARDAMRGNGTIRFTAKAEPGPAIRLAVTDTGTGMTPEILARAAEPFFTTKQHGHGTGLGLAMSRGFAEQSGGALFIDSTPGKGTTVAIVLPLAPRDEAEPNAATPGATPRQPEPPPHRTIRLLLVDDEASVRETLGRALHDEGFAVLSATSGADALAVIDAGAAIDLVVADLSMPGMDGLAMLAELRRRRPALPAILLTGYATSAAEAAITGTLGQALALIRKPVDPKTLSHHAALMIEAAGLGG